MTFKMLPIRCFTCNKVIGRYDEQFEICKQKGEDLASFFDTFNITRYCCKKIFMTHIDIFQYDPKNNLENVQVSSGNMVTKILKAD